MKIVLNKKMKAVIIVLAVITAVHLTLALLPYKQLEFFLNREFSTRVYDSAHNLIQVTPLSNGLRREYISVKKIPEKIKETFIKEEDKRFYFHLGIDFISAGRALFQNAANQKNVSGASTITMQLAKMINNSYENQENKFNVNVRRTILKKINESFCALMLEARFSKNEILELYLNSIPFGNNVEGIMSASRLYFAKELSDLSDSEIEALSKIPRRPSLYSPQKKYVYPFYMPHLVQYLKENNFFENSGKNPYEVVLTANMDVQSYAQDMALKAMDQAVDSRISNISILVMDVKTGGVLAWVGNSNFYDEENSGQIDGVRFKNQPGSSIKPFLYALALEKGIVKPTTVLPDVPMEFGEDKAYVPLNFSNRFYGPVRLRVSLASSLNIPAVYLLDQLGIETFADKLEELHISKVRENAERMNLGMALGACEVSMNEFLPAFTVFVRDGNYIPLSFFNEKNGNPLSVRQKGPHAKGEKIYSTDTSRLIASILSDKSARSLGFGYYQTFQTDYPSIFKTGTSNQFQNITALGATPRYAVGVWMGNFSGETVIGKTGSSLPAWVAKNILDYLERFDDEESLLIPEPEHYKKIAVCPLSGMKATELCETSVFEYVREGDELGDCTWHERVHGRKVVSYPEQYQNWLRLNDSRYEKSSRKISYADSELKIVYPRNDSRFFINDFSQTAQVLNLEVSGGTSDVLDIYVDDRFYTQIRRPFFAHLPLERGRHVCRVVCGNQENIVFYEVR